MKQTCKNVSVLALLKSKGWLKRYLSINYFFCVIKLFYNLEYLSLRLLVVSAIKNRYLNLPLGLTIFCSHLHN